MHIYITEAYTVQFMFTYNNYVAINSTVSQMGRLFSTQNNDI